MLIIDVRNRKAESQDGFANLSCCFYRFKDTSTLLYQSDLMLSLNLVIGRNVIKPFMLTIRILHFIGRVFVYVTHALYFFAEQPTLDTSLFRVASINYKNRLHILSNFTQNPRRAVFSLKQA